MKLVIYVRNLMPKLIYSMFSILFLTKVMFYFACFKIFSWNSFGCGLKKWVFKTEICFKLSFDWVSLIYREVQDTLMLWADHYCIWWS